MRRIMMTIVASLFAVSAAGTIGQAQQVPPNDPPESPDSPGIPYPYPEDESPFTPRDTLQDLSFAETICFMFHSAAGGGDPDFVDRVCGTNLEGNNPPDDGD
ncbi:hypothetical protein [uncultured Maricaulis sp.]|uniref:hypothetical protein n=1 Tax=uncultured Maricaulis sp. TaxID=174710 RepID=UPI0030D76E54